MDELAPTKQIVSSPIIFVTFATTLFEQQLTLTERVSNDVVPGALLGVHSIKALCWIQGIWLVNFHKYKYVSYVHCDIEVLKKLPKFFNCSILCILKWYCIQSKIFIINQEWWFPIIIATIIYNKDISIKCQAQRVL